MGTRHLIAVMSGGEYKIAQYGQWDGYPEGQGVTVWEFCKNRLDLDVRRKAFVEKLTRCRWATDDELKAAAEKAAPGRSDGWMTMEQAAEFNRLMPFMSRDIGGKILAMVDDSDAKEILLSNSISFAGDSLFCEFAYVVDLDKKSFECFKGFNHAKLDEGERFARAPLDEEANEKRDASDRYDPVKLVRAFSLDDLPTTEKAFLEAMEKAIRSEE